MLGLVSRILEELLTGRAKGVALAEGALDLGAHVRSRGVLRVSKELIRRFTGDISCPPRCYSQLA